MDTESIEITSHDDNGHGAAGRRHEEQRRGRPARAARPAPGVDPAPEPETHPVVDRLEALLESLLFAAGEPVPVGRLVEALGGPGRAEVVHALEALGRRYERAGGGIRLVQVAGGYQLRTPAAHGPWIRRLLRERPPRLSRPMLETLAIIAYRQPCTRIEIEAVRGVDADAVLATLTDRRLVRILGRKEAPGRPLLYGTTREFLEVFSLPDLAALPPLRDLGEGAELLAARELGDGEAGGAPQEGEAPPSDDGSSEGS